MNKLMYILLFLCLHYSVNGQSDFEDRVKYIKRNIEIISGQEKEALRSKVEEINQNLEDKELTSEEADMQKKAAAEKCAAMIEQRIEPFENELRELIKSEVKGKDERIESLDDDEDDDEDDEDDDDENKDDDRADRKKEINIDGFKFDWKPRHQRKMRNEQRTTTQFVFAFGLNNIVSDDNLGTIENNGIRLSNSRFYEWGWTWKTRLAANSPFLNLKYGLSLTYNNLRPDNNQYYVKNGGKTLLAEHPFSLRDEPYFRMTNLVIPVHLEFDFSKRKKLDDDKMVIRTQKSVRAGIGGYAGINTRTKQILKYKADGLRTDQTTKGDYNTSDFIYGISAYIGYRDVSLYTKYDLNPIFTDNTVEQNNISFGLRFDFH